MLYLLSRFVLATLCALLPVAAAGQGFPARPLTMIVTVPAGGSIDVMGRLIAAELAKSIGQPVVVENKPGAGGNIAAEFVAKAPPDGHTMMITSSSTLAINPHVYKNLPFDPEKSFAPVVTTGRLNMLLAVHPSHNVSNLQEFAALMKSRPGGLSFGSSGLGTLPHLAGELLALRVGAKANHVPYKGLPAAMNDLIAGRIDFMFDSANAVPQVKAGKLDALAVVGPNRLSPLPEVGTFRELGVRGMEAAAGWYGIFVPGGTPAAVVDRLNADIVKILEMPTTKDKLTTIGLEPASSTSRELAAALKGDLEQFRSLIQQLNLNLQN